MPGEPRVGIALGGGGAKGLAHIPLLEVIDELGVRPHAIAGTSIGALLGALYAAGMSGAELRQSMDTLLHPERVSDRFVRTKGRRPSLRHILKWLELVRPSGRRASLLHLDRLFEALAADFNVSTFEGLQIPLRVVAADLWERKEVVFDSGPLVPALKASSALSGIFEPAEIDDRVLVDGGAVNPVPYDLLLPDCDVTIAIDVLGQRTRGRRLPSMSDSIFATFQIMERTILLEKMRLRPPTILIEPELLDVRVLEFQKADSIYERTAPAAEQLRRELAAVLPRAAR